MIDARFALRSYSTIGIHSLFLSPIPEELLPQSYLVAPSACFSTPEIIGTIKSEPEDFCVRELATEKLKLSPEYKIADLRDVPQHTQLRQAETSVATEKVEMIDVLDVEKEVQPLEVVRRVLESQHEQTWKAEFSDLHNLQEKALLALQGVSLNEDIVLIPPVSPEVSCLTTIVQRSGDRGSLHRCLKLAFPLLQSESIKREDGDPLIRVSVDTSFFALAPSVHEPMASTLQALYEFHKKGPPGIQKCHQNRKRKLCYNELIEGDPFSFILPLHPGISKDERRKIHHVISSKTRDFETGTASEYTDAKGIKTSAIVLTWSKAAIRNASTFRTGKSKAIYHVFVLKKRRKEHLAAMQTLTRVLQCRQSDLGTAGIKDMHAVTYQFCTIRGFQPDRLLRANDDLRQHGMEIGSVTLTDHFLQPGQLHGNNFVVIVRDVMRVYVEMKDGHVHENFCPCHNRDYITERVNAVRKFGFVNFFGEQRVGVPGESEVVGVRSFDIGKAMLQGDFDKALDLLMTGRLICRGIDNQEDASVRNCRQVWKDSGGDAEETYKALPKSDCMSRERTVLQGLKRYRNSLDAIKCLHFRDRSFWIHSYQSYIWNTMASERLQLYGGKVVAGDLFTSVNGVIDVVSDDTASSIRLDQIILPLPGYGVKYPTNEMGDRYIQLLQREKVTFEKDAVLEATAKGSYRRLVVAMSSLQLEFIAPETSDDKSFQITFDLPPGSYATMLLRELMVKTVARS